MARRQDNGKYCVRDNKTDAVAVTADSQSRYENLGFNQALDATIELNESDRPKMSVPPATAAPQQVAQQRQQPQADDIDDKKEACSPIAATIC